MQVRERAREIGTLKAIGASNGGVTIQFLTEALAFTLLGGVLGLVVFRLLGEAVTGRFFALGIGPFLPSQYKPLFESLTVSSHVPGSVFFWSSWLPCSPPSSVAPTACGRPSSSLRWRR
jgi:ABC-type antimicrobial peptide transport system permease subunit